MLGVPLLFLTLKTPVKVHIRPHTHKPSDKPSIVVFFGKKISTHLHTSVGPAMERCDATNGSIADMHKNITPSATIRCSVGGGQGYGNNHGGSGGGGDDGEDMVSY